MIIHIHIYSLGFISFLFIFLHIIFFFFSLFFFFCFFFFFSSRRRHTRWPRDWSSDVCLPISALDPLDQARAEQLAAPGGPHLRPVVGAGNAELHEPGRPGGRAGDPGAAGARVSVRTLTEIGRASCRERAEESEVAVEQTTRGE